MNINCPYCERNLTPHEIGTLFARVGDSQPNQKNAKRFGGAKLRMKDVDSIRRSKVSTREIAKKYKVSPQTIRRVKKGITYKAHHGLNCPHCGDKLTQHEVIVLFGSLGGRRTSHKKKKTSAINGRTVAKLTQKLADEIRKSNEPFNDLAQKYKVGYHTIWRIKKNKIWISQ